MDLNRMGSGKKLIDKIVNKGGTDGMGWSIVQQLDKIAKQKNPLTPKTRFR